MYQRLINNTLGDPERAKRFIATITSAVAVNANLQECDSGTILAAALLGESLNLSPSPQLGQFYLVPFKDNKNKIVKAQFIIGYKGYIQLAIRSGQYKRLNVIEIKQGELKHFDPLNEVIDYIMIDDFDKWEEAPTIGYYVMFEYINGFRKAMYWSKKKMLAYADKYAPAFSAQKYSDLIEGRIPGLTLKMIQDGVYIVDKTLYETASKLSSFWYKDFDGMAKKTMIRQLISKWGVMSTEFVTAIEHDNKVVEANNGNIVIADTPNIPDTSEIPEIIPEATDIVEQVNLEDI